METARTHAEEELIKRTLIGPEWRTGLISFWREHWGCKMVEIFKVGICQWDRTRSYRNKVGLKKKLEVGS